MVRAGEVAPLITRSAEDLLRHSRELHAAIARFKEDPQDPPERIVRIERAPLALPVPR